MKKAKSKKVKHKKSVVMAKKKKHKRKAHLSAPSRTTGVKRRRRRHSKRRAMLSANPGIMKTGTAMLSGFIGGVAGNGIDKGMSAMGLPAWGSALAKGLGAFAIGHLTGADNVAAGIMGQMSGSMTRPMFGLSEGNANWAKPVESLPMYISEQGVALSESQAANALSEAFNEQPAGSYLPNYMSRF